MPATAARSRGRSSSLPVIWIILTICTILIIFHPCRALGGSNNQNLARDLKAIVSDPAIRPAKIGIVVESMTTGKSIFEYNADRRFVPASNMKLLTSAAALFVLTPDFRYETRLMTNGYIESEILYGDLIVEGSGDPTISGYFNNNDVVYVFKDWTKQLIETGIREIQGDLIVDNSAFSENPYGDGWDMDDMTRCFCAPRDAFTFNNNCIQLEIIPAAQKERGVELIMEPASDYIRLINRLNSQKATGRDTIRLTYSDPRTLEVRGTKKPGSTATIHYIAMNYPAQFGAFVLKETLISGGIKMTGDIMCARNCPNIVEISLRKKNRPSRTLAVYHSVKLSEIIKVVNKLSNNLYSEMLLFAIGRTSGGVFATKNAAAIALQALNKAGVDVSGIVMADGCGLSRKNLVTPRQIARLLKVMADGPYSAHFYESLPIMSEDGTLLRRLKGSRASGMIRAKTGTMTGVRSLSGYMTTHNDDRLIFSIFSNNHVSVAAIDKMVDKIILRLLDYSSGQ